MADIKVDLRDLEKGLECVELVQKAGMIVVQSGNQMIVHRDRESPHYNDSEARRVIDIIKANREAMLNVTEDREKLRQTLCNAQERMSKANTWLLTHVDLWERLEKTYRTLFPEIDEVCVMGEKCLDDALVRCRACEQKDSIACSITCDGGGRHHDS